MVIHNTVAPRLAASSYDIDTAEMRPSKDDRRGREAEETVAFSERYVMPVSRSFMQQTTSDDFSTTAKATGLGLYHVGRTAVEHNTISICHRTSPVVGRHYAKLGGNVSRNRRRCIRGERFDHVVTSISEHRRSVTFWG